MSHIPVNHPLRPTYRVLAALVALYVLVFGVTGVIQAGGDPFFSRGDVQALGLRTNLAFALASVLAGLVILAAIWIGRNADYVVNVWGGVAFLVAGTAMLALLHTDLNVLNFSVTTVIVSFVIGTVLFSAGLYSRTGSSARARAEQLARTGGH